MQLNILRESLDAFSSSLANGWESDIRALYQTVPAWQTNWPPTTPQDLANTLDKTLQNQRTRAFWQGHAYYPKEVLCKLSSFAPDMMNLAFGKLFDESLELTDRFSSFGFYLDEMLAEYNRNNPTTSLTSHYHSDYRAASLYCAMRHPETHGYFEPDHYVRTLLFLKAKDVGPIADPNRFMKSTKVIMTFALKHDKLWHNHLARLSQDDFPEVSALLASEYIRYTATMLA